MYSIIINSQDKGLSFTTFYDKFLQICQQHKDNNKALLFAFILYDFENPQIAKVLKDSDYWLSLNAISGQYLTVFSIHYKPKIRFKKAEDSIVYRDISPVSYFGNPSELSNSLIKKYFSDDMIVKYPAVMFFQVHANEVIDYTLIELDGKEIEVAFNELKLYISNAVEALKLITKENRNNSKEIFQLVESKVEGIRTKIVAKKTLKKVSSIVELGSLIVDLGG